MSATQKYAWFNLTVIGLTVAVVLVLSPSLGRGALGGLGLTGLLGFGCLFFRRRPGKVIQDERDGLIWVRSVGVAFAVFWVSFVFAAAVLAPLRYGWDGAIPVLAVGVSVFVGLMLFLAVQAVAILIQYARGD